MRYAFMSSTEILENLCNKIRKLELEPGAKISENEIALLYNVSRSTVRTVFSKLEQMHLIERYPQIGTIISTFDLSYIHDALYIRDLVEMDVLEDVMKLKDKKVLISKLENNIKSQEKFRNSLNYEEQFKDVDDEFHGMILESVGKKALMDIIKDSIIHIERWKIFDIRSRNRINMLIDQHILIFEAIKKNDIKMAKKILNKHLLDMEDSFIMQAKLEHPDYF
jgi:DNA-binding GntR family transcriptional regulator